MTWRWHDPIWLDHAERLPNGDHVGDMVADAAPKLLLHKTQSPVGTQHRLGADAAWDAVIRTLSGNRSQPHLVYDPSTRRLGQYISLHRAGAALANDPGGVQTNRGGPIQVEVLGYSEDSPSDPDEWVRNLAEDVAAPVCRIFGIPPKLFRNFVGPEAGFIAREDAPQRIPMDLWLALCAIIAHQNAPENEHWDVGRYKGALLVATVAAILGGTTTTDEEHELMTATEDILAAIEGVREDVLDQIERSRPEAVRLSTTAKHQSGIMLTKGEVWVVSAGGMFHAQQGALDIFAVAGMIKNRKPLAPPLEAKFLTSVPIIDGPPEAQG